MPDDDSIADEHPSNEKLSAILDGSNVYVEEVERIEDVIREEIEEFTDDIQVEDVDQIDQIGKCSIYIQWGGSGPELQGSPQ